MKYLKIPMERVGVLIGNKGETKKVLEDKTGLEIDINSKTGEVSINEPDSKDPLLPLKVENIVKAIGRGFSPEKAMRLLKDGTDFFIFDIRDYGGNKSSQVRRIKGRIIGKNGKTKNLLEDLTGANISVFGHTVAVIARLNSMNILKKAIDMLLSGSRHGSVYRVVEKEMKELKLKEKLESF